MVLVTWALFIYPLLGTGILLLLFFWHQARSFHYWRDRGVPHMKQNWIFGNIGDILLRKTNFAGLFEKAYEQFKENGFGGIFLFGKPAIVICSPEMVEKVLVQDFMNFEDRTDVWNFQETLTKSLFNAPGDKWRKMRHNLVPMFTTAKLKGVIHQMFKCGDLVLRKVEEQAIRGQPVEIEVPAYEYTTDTIASSTFGIQLMSESCDRKSFRSVMNATYNLTSPHLIKIFLLICYPKIFYCIKKFILPHLVIQYFVNLTKSTIEYRRQNGTRREDLLQLMLTLKEKEYVTDLDVQNGKEYKLLHRAYSNAQHEKLFTEEFIASQLFSFLTIGTKPSELTVTFALLEIARNCAIQKQLQDEIDFLLAKNGEWNFALFQETPYLDQVVQETLRMYSFSSMLLRVVTKLYRLPGTSVTLEPGMFVYIPTAAIHADPRYYPAPKQFLPERFAGNHYKPSATYLPFGHGPRICVAIKYATLLVKVILARLLADYTVRLSSKTAVPVRMDERLFFPKCKATPIFLHRRQLRLALVRRDVTAQLSAGSTPYPLFGDPTPVTYQIFTFPSIWTLS
ncbi:hypothetical protein J6590_061212 [Homalodisca vitripennis]|nr:hypothetical protein J6590_061212 [Homalodisca vitripennis]